MKTKVSLGRLLLLLVIALPGSVSIAPAQSSASTFTYQGRLKIGGGMPNPGALFDFRVRLFDAPADGLPIGGIVTPCEIPVVDGLFNFPLDFGPMAFTGAPRWLQIEVRPATSSSSVPFTLLTPRQLITAAPQSQFAGLAGKVREGAIDSLQLMTGAVHTVNLDDGAVTGAKIADGNIVRGLNGLKDQITLTVGEGLMLTPLGNELRLENSRSCLDYTNCYWNLLGNGNTADAVNFLGTINNVALNVRVNNQRAWRVEPGGTPNLIGGHALNAVVTPAFGGHIGGGGAPGAPNLILENFGTIGGGSGHGIHNKALYATIGGGRDNIVSTNSSYATVAGGEKNRVGTNVTYAAIGGGRNNTIEPNALAATIGGGALNLIATNATNAVLAGGTANRILRGAVSSSLLGGQSNTIHIAATYATLGGGQRNNIETNADFATLAGGRANTVSTNADYGTIGGGRGSLIYSNVHYATIPGGFGAAATNYGQFAYASGSFIRPGDAQLCFYVVRTNTFDANTNRLSLDGLSEQMKLRAGATWTYDVQVAARSAAGASAGYHFRGVIKRVGAVTSFVPGQIKNVLGEDAPALDAQVVFDDVQDCLAVEAIGLVGVEVRWVATVRITELVF